MHSRRGDGQPPGDADKSSREEEGAHARGRLTASSRDGHREKLGWEKKRTRLDFPTAGDMRRGRRITSLSHDATHGLFSAPFGRTRALDGWLSRQAHALSVAAAAAAALAAAVMTPTSSVMNSGCAVLWMEWAAPSNLRTAQPGSRAWDENSRPEAAATSASSTHAPPAPGQAQGGHQPRPASANWQLVLAGRPQRPVDFVCSGARLHVVDAALALPRAHAAWLVRHPHMHGEGARRVGQCAPGLRPVGGGEHPLARLVSVRVRLRLRVRVRNPSPDP